MSQARATGIITIAVALVLRASAGLAEVSKETLDHEYLLAVSDYEAGRSAQAADRLEKLLPYARTSSEVHELLGMVYVSLSQSDKALEELKVAVQIKPDWTEARTNLGMALLSSGRSKLAGEQFRKAHALSPNAYETNHNLGEYLVESGEIAEAQPFLQRAHAIKPVAYDNSYDLAAADLRLNRLEDARSLVLELLKQRNAAELHNLLGQIEEKRGEYVAAANAYEAAAHLDPTENNLFDWGCEMLLHRTYEPAIQIFQEAARRYPRSPRILIGLGLSLYARGKYDDAVEALLSAANLDPSDARCYIFLSKAYDSSPKQADAVIQAFRRYAEMQPSNAKAQYYYALSLWKGRRAENTTVDLGMVEALLRKAITLDDSLADAHEQLGNVYADRHAYEQSIPEYVRALQLNPGLSDAHYRLATEYVHTGQKEKAQAEFAIYQKLRADHLAEADKERAEVQQFVYSAKAPPQQPRRTDE